MSSQRKTNWTQFWLLVLVNAFVGGMLGFERSVLPLLAKSHFALQLGFDSLSFIAIFGLSKAISNYFTGSLAGKLGRKKLLLIGWFFLLPVPLLLQFGGNWGYVLLANLFLGIGQGFAWSSTVMMKIDWVGDKKRGFAMGLNEFAGYLSVGLVGYGSSQLLENYSIEAAFGLSYLLLLLGTALSVFWVKESLAEMKAEAQTSSLPRAKSVFWETSLRNPSLSSVTQAGLVNNLNDGMVWGLFPLLLSSKGFSLPEIGFLSAIYPATWGISQLFTGGLSDKICKKDLLYLGMLLQALALFSFAYATDFYSFAALAILLGLGTALVYPSFLAAIAEHSHPEDRAKSLGIFRFWRDMGYAIGAVLTGILLQWTSIETNLLLVSLLTGLSGYWVYIRMRCGANKKPGIWEYICLKAGICKPSAKGNCAKEPC